MTDNYDLLLATLAKVTCSEFTCDGCKSYYGFTCECPIEDADKKEWRSFAKRIFELTKDPKYYDRGSCPFDTPWSEDDIMELIRDENEFKNLFKT